MNMKKNILPTKEEKDILKSIVEDLNQKKLEINKEHLMNYFTPFAMRLMSGN